MVLGGGGWRGASGPYQAVAPPPPGGGGGYQYSWGQQGVVGVIAPGVGGGGGRVQSSAAPLAGFQGCSGPGPGAYIGIGG